MPWTLARHTASSSAFSNTCGRIIGFELMHVTLKEFRRRNRDWMKRNIWESKSDLPKNNSKCSNYQCLWVVSIYCSPPQQEFPITWMKIWACQVCFGNLWSASTPPSPCLAPGGGGSRLAPRATNVATLEMLTQPSEKSPRHWLKREAADGPPVRDIPDSLWKKLQGFNWKDKYKDANSNCSLKVYTVQVELAYQAKQQISQINPNNRKSSLFWIQFLEWLRNFVSINLFVSHLFHIFWRQTKPLCVGKLGRNGKNDETFTLKRRDCKHISPCLEPGLSFWVGAWCFMQQPLIYSWKTGQSPSVQHRWISARTLGQKPKEEAILKKASMAHGEIPILGYWLKREGEGRDRPAKCWKG